MKRAIGLIPMLLWASGAVAQDAASEATRAAQAELAARLPLDDPADMANATRGKIAEIADGVIIDKDGRIVWDRRPYAFLAADKAPDTVNPSLWRQARLNAVHGLFEVVPGKIGRCAATTSW